MPPTTAASHFKSIILGAATVHVAYPAYDPLGSTSVQPPSMHTTNELIIIDHATVSCHFLCQCCRSGSCYLAGSLQTNKHIAKECDALDCSPPRSSYEFDEHMSHRQPERLPSAEPHFFFHTTPLGDEKNILTLTSDASLQSFNVVEEQVTHSGGSGPAGNSPQIAPPDEYHDNRELVLRFSPIPADIFKESAVELNQRRDSCEAHRHDQVSSQTTMSLSKVRTSLSPCLS